MSNSALDQTDGSGLTGAFQPHTAERNVLTTAKGGGIVFLGKLFTFACRMVITFLLARLLGADQYGLYNLTLTALSVAAAMAAFGLDTALVRYIALFARRGDEPRLWGTIQIGLGITLALSLVLSACLYFLADSIAMGIFREARLEPLLQAASLVVPILTLSNVIAAITQGFKKMQYATVARDITQPLLRLVLTIVLVVVGASPLGALVIYGVSVTIAAALLLYFLHRRLFSLRRPIAAAHRETREVLSFSLPVFISDLMTMFRDNIQTLLLGALNTIANAGIFAVASQLNLVGHMFQSAIATASRPLIAELYDGGDREQMAHMYQTTTKWTFSVNLPLFLTLTLFPSQILSIFGESFVAGAPALVLLAWAIMVDITSGQCGVILDMTGRTGWKLVNAIARLVLSLALSVVLIPRWGVLGAATATLITLALINFARVLQVFLLLRLQPYNASFAKPLAAGLAALLTALALDTMLPDVPLSVALQVIALFGVYAAAIVALGLAPEDRAVLSRVRRRLRSMAPRSGNNDHQPQA